MNTALDQPAVPAGGDTASGEDRSCDEEPPSRLRLALERVDDDGDWTAFGPVDDLIEAVGRVVAEAPELAQERAGTFAASAAVALSSDASVRRLNAAYRSKDTPTNVLSFPAPPPPGGLAADMPRALGDVILALETLVDEAQTAGIPAANHFQHLLIHGLLHLMGYDHETDTEAEQMEALETVLLARLGIPDPYAEALP